jgi:hypothetical protein
MSVLCHQSKPQAHELKFSVTLPKKLMTRRRVVVAPEIAAYRGDQAHRLAQQERRFQAFFFA